MTLPLIYAISNVELSEEQAALSEEGAGVVETTEVDVIDKELIDHGDKTRLLYLLRLLRIKKILVILHTQTFQSFIKLYFRANLQSAIKRNSSR